MEDVEKYSNILLIGGATRNVGKTTFTCSVIEKNSAKYTIIALKIKTIYEGDDFFHGKNRNPLIGNYRIIEEKNAGEQEDTERMLKAGANRVFRIKTKSNFLKEAFEDFYAQLAENSFIVCESNSLRNVLKPSIFILIKHKNSEEIKPSAKKLAPLADKIIYTDGIEHDFNAKKIIISNNKWIISGGVSR